MRASGMRALWAALLGLMIVLPSRQGWSKPAQATKTLSPYFFIQNGDPKVDRLPLRKTDVKVSVGGVIADVTVTQTYENQGQRPINAKYVFPASTRAAVHGMRMKIGDRLIEAKIEERQKAKRQYEAAKRAGKTATLLEQQRPNVFSMSVANVMPKDRIEVTLSYTELLVPTEGTYEFVFPTVVGPRYSETPEAGASAANAWVKSPYLQRGKLPPQRFDIQADLASAVPIASLSVPSHQVRENWTQPTLVKVRLADSEKQAQNRDFILRYRLAGDRIQSGLSLFEQGKKKFFLAVVQPPKRVLPAQIPPREYVFVVDVSGSMRGFPLNTAKTLLQDLVGKLRPIDKFNVLFFSGGSSLLSPQSLPASQQNIDAAVRMLSQLQGGGGTRLLPALQRALSLSTEGVLSRSFVVITDGYISAEKEVFDYIRGHLNRANVFAFGIGGGVNRYLIEGLAKAGMGEPFVVTDPQHTSAEARRFRKYVSSPVLTGVRVAFEKFDAYDVVPQAIPDVLSERPVVIFGKYRGQPTGSIKLTGASGAGKYQKRLQVSTVQPKPENRALPYLWARTRIAQLSDFGESQVSDQARAQIVRLGLSYNLLTRYTSFVAISKQVRNSGAHATPVKQPLPLPAGVQNSAVGGPMLGADEPELLWLVALTAFLMLVLLRVNRKASWC